MIGEDTNHYTNEETRLEVEWLKYKVEKMSFNFS